MYSFESRVRYSECDRTGRLSLVSMVNYLQDCSTFHSEEVDCGFKALGERGIAWILAIWRIEIDELPALGENITVSTWCYEMTRSHANRCFSIRDASGKALVRADSQWFVYDTARGRVGRVPEDQRVYLGEEPRLEMAPLEKRLQPEGEGQVCSPVAVRAHNLDTNQHMNNAQYVLLALDALAELGHAGPVGSIEVLYRKMALLGDVIVPVVYRHNEGWDVELTGEDGAAYAILRLG